MGDFKNLFGQDAVKKLKEIAEHTNICMFCTQSSELPFPTRPMATQEVDEEGNFWFFSGRESNKNKELKQDDTVQLIYSNVAKSEYLSVTGQVDIYTDHAKIDELWNGMIKAWFKEGKDDPNLTLIRVRPTDTYYWDTKDGKIMSMLKISISAITGASFDGGVEGNANV